MVGRKSIKLITSFILLFVCLDSVQARIGETRSTLEGRLLQDRTAIKVPERKMRALINHQTVPYRHLLMYFPENAEQVLYYKPASDEKAEMDDLDTEFPRGWMLHVVFYKGRSVFEAYRRNGSKVNRHEQSGLLLLNKGDSFWKKVDEGTRSKTAIGYSMERDDGEIRALPAGSFLIFYMPEFDEGIKVQLDERRAKSDASAKERAPDSIQGF